MSIYQTAYLDTLNRNGIRYQVMDDNNVSVTFSGHSGQNIQVIASFDPQGTNLVTFISFDIAKFEEDAKYAKGLVLCNDANKQFRWVKFYVNDSRSLTAQLDALVENSTAGDECYNLLMRCVGIIDEAYPMFAKIL